MDEKETGGYRGLDVYRRSHDFAVKVHRTTLTKLPAFEKYEEGSQIRRSAKSIVANIVEGYGRRRYRADYIRFLVTAHASCDETEAHLQLLAGTGSLSPECTSELLGICRTIGRQLYGLIASVEREHASAPTKPSQP
jgi:four helix bundle protein